MSETRKVVINACFGGFGLSDAAYLKLSEWYGIPIRKYKKELRNPETQRYERPPENEGEVIFDRELTGPEEDSMSAIYHKYKDSGAQQRYWSAWDMTRDDPRLIRLVEEMGEAANGPHAELRIVEIPADVQWAIAEYDGNEHVEEEHQTWR